ncbi:COX15/CtaA family protein [Roseomonas sp. HF4]|uniref:COX15/CtaA family protein n=1 Tax=Roseomonas sp. HF4 TaxID=2562313 RepID=UPI0010BF88B1|nr:COX15/CtaA family protein [Roseomonas sp. HF4]
MPFDARSPAGLTIHAAATDARAVARWLLLVAGMVWLMVAIGGATRLTGSGLSIMEWAPIAGILPPLSEAEWRRLYDLYRTIPQYQLVNQGFGIEGFKEIFWLEWIHRFWGRMIGFAYVAGLAWFWLRGRVPPGLKPRLLLLLALGGLQGAIGWFMVASGFEADRTAVSPYRLVIHLGMAFLLFGVLLWTALTLLRPVPEAAPVPPALRRWVYAAAGLAVLAMLAGGFVAGIRAGFAYNSFPLMDGRLVPEGYWDLTPAWKNLTANIPAVQFNHRLLATAALLSAAWAAVLAWRSLSRGRVRGAVMGFGIAVGLQYALGIATLLAVVPVWLGTLHQTIAVLVLAGALLALHALRRPAPE